MATAPEMRIFTLKDPEGVEVNEVTATVGGRRKTFRFPYATNDQREIDFLLLKGARPRQVVARLERAPNPLSNQTLPLKGGGK
jgi:hypothetical protein